MMNTSAHGTQVHITADKTYPQGITVTEFADDADGFDIPAMQIADKAMGLNGDMVAWSKAAPIEITLNVIPGGEDDRNLQILGEANRVAKNKTSAGDVITLILTRPDGTTETYRNGLMTNYMPGDSGTSAGRLKTKPYSFAFETKGN